MKRIVKDPERFSPMRRRIRRAVKKILHDPKNSKAAKTEAGIPLSARGQ